MVSLKNTGRRFEIQLAIVEGGSGFFRGELTETDQKQIPVYAFVNPRHVLRTRGTVALQSGMVIRSPAGLHYIVGDNGPSERPEGEIWQSYRLFEATRQVTWERRTKVIDPVTKLPRDTGRTDMGLIWAAVEPLDREVSDFRMSASFEQSRVITGQPIQQDDLVDGRKVTRAESVLGCTIGVLT